MADVSVLGGTSRADNHASSFGAETGLAFIVAAVAPIVVPVGAQSQAEPVAVAVAFGAAGDAVSVVLDQTG